MSFFIKKLALTQFRNYSAARLTASREPIVLFGENGAGKTNVLEAISLLSPGRGIRRARISDLKNLNAPAHEYWAVSAELETPGGQRIIGTGQRAEQDGRIIRIDGKDQGSQSPLGEISAVVWLTPQMDGLFLDSPSSRRRFLDRMVAGFDPKHTGRTTQYDKWLRERSSLLKQKGGKGPDPEWLSTLEHQLAECGIAIAAARRVFAERLTGAIDRLGLPEQDFPKPRIEVSGTIDDYLRDHPALDTEDYFKSLLQKSRQQDSYTGGSEHGTHKSDLKVFHKTLNMPAENCSTGEQKGLLVNLILAEASLVKAERGFPPLLLLDDIAAHLDTDRQNILFDSILNLKSQCWMTGTHKTDFKSLAHIAHFIHVHQGRFTSL